MSTTNTSQNQPSNTVGSGTQQNSANSTATPIPNSRSESTPPTTASSSPPKPQPIQLLTQPVNDPNIVLTLDTKNNFLELYSYVEEKMITHGQAKRLFSKRNLWFVIPSILITGLSGVLSFLSSSTLILSEDAKEVLVIAVGILSSISAILQSISGACNFNGKSEAHSIATEDFEQIHTRLTLELHKNEFAEYNTGFYQSIVESILEINKKCNYLIPNDIQEQYRKNKTVHELENMHNRYVKKILQRREKKLDTDLESKKTFDLLNLQQELKLMRRNIRFTL